MGRWPVDKYILDVGDPDGHYDLSEIGKWAAGDIAERHNADIDALAAEVDEWKEKERITSELFEAACNDLGDAQEELAAAIEYAHSRDAERDELKRRLEEVVARFDKAYIASKSESASNAILALYKECKAIAEGRTE